MDRSNMSDGDPVPNLSHCFDPGLASYPTRRLPIQRVIDLLHVTHSPERVEEYRKAMLDGHRFPPVSVLRVGPYFLITDGHKRFSAYRSLRRPHILVESWTVAKWLSDQGQQLDRDLRTWARALWRSLYSPPARREVVRLARTRLAHYRRVGCSLMRWG